MSMTDPIADFLTRIRNGIMAAHEEVEIPASRLKREMARILLEQGYIAGVDEVPARGRGVAGGEAEGRDRGGERSETAGSAGDKLLIRLKYTDDRTSVISGLRRVSRPGQRTYVDAKHIPKVLGGMGTAIVSTSQGVMTGHDARRAGVGGEVVAEVW